jgi:hypothetical protein
MGWISVLVAAATRDGGMPWLLTRLLLAVIVVEATVWL